MLEHYLASDPRDYLKLEFEMRHRRSPAYSLRAFSRDLKMSCSCLSDFLHGKMGLSHRRVEQLSHILQLSERQRSHWHDLVDYRHARSQVQRRQAHLRIQSRLKAHPDRLDLERFRAISDWHHFAIVSLLELGPEFQSPIKMAKALKLRAKTVREAIQRLLQVGLLIEENGKLRPNSNSTTTGDEAASEAIRENHRQTLQLALRALSEQGQESRESCSIVFSISSSKLKECREELRRATLDVLSRYVEASEDADTVTAFTMHLFNIANRTDPSGEVPQ